MLQTHNAQTGARAGHENWCTNTTLCAHQRRRYPVRGGSRATRTLHIVALPTAPGTLAQVQSPYLSGNLPQEMQPDADPDQAGEPRPTRGRIELAKPAPHAPVFVPADKHRAMCTGAALAMQHPHVTGQQHPIAGIAHASAQVQSLKVQKLRLIKTVHALEHGARQEHERAGHCLGSDDMIG